MKNHIKQLSVALVAIFCILLCTFQAFATPDVVTDTTPVQTEAPVVTEAPIIETEPVTEAPIVETEPATEPATEATTAATQPKTQATQKPTYATQSPTVAATQATTSYVAAQTTPAVNNYVDDDDDNNQNQSSTLYDSDKRVDTNDLDDSDWAEITERLKNNNGSSSTGDDFGFIQNNNDDGDNGLWILIVGILLILAGIGIIATLIALHIKKKNGLSNNKNDKNPPSDKSNGGKRVSPTEKKQINKRSKYDTAEVYIPRRTASKSRSSYGGTRYKPKH